MPTELKDARNCPGTVYLGGETNSHYWDVSGGEFRPSVGFWSDFSAAKVFDPSDMSSHGLDPRVGVQRIKLEVCPKCQVEHEWRSRRDAKSGREFVKQRMGESSPQAVVKLLLE